MRSFVAGLERELNALARSGRARGPELAELAEQRVRAYEADPARRGSLRDDHAQPAEAEVEIQLVADSRDNAEVARLRPWPLSRQDRAFLGRLARDLSQQMNQGRLAEDAIPQAVAKAMQDYAQASGRTPSWGDRPNTTVMVKLTIKF